MGLKEGAPDPESEFLNRYVADVECIINAINRMKATSLCSTDAEWIAETIRDGLSPACEVTQEQSFENVPVINPDDHRPMACVGADSKLSHRAD